MDFRDDINSEISDEASSDIYSPPKELSGHPPFSIFSEASNHSLFEFDTIPIFCPVRLIHGKSDTLVPYQNSLRLAEKMASHDAEVLLVDNADHRFSAPDNLVTITTVLEDLLNKV